MLGMLLVLPSLHGGWIFDDHLQRLKMVGSDRWPECWVLPSAALEFLPYRSAIAKMNLLTSVVRESSQVAVNE